MPCELTIIKTTNEPAACLSKIELFELKTSQKLNSCFVALLGALPPLSSRQPAWLLRVAFTQRRRHTR